MPRVTHVQNLDKEQLLLHITSGLYLSFYFPGADVRGHVQPVQAGLRAGSAVDVARLGAERAAQLHAQVSALSLHLVPHRLLRLRRHLQPLLAGQLPRLPYWVLFSDIYIIVTLQ